MPSPLIAKETGRQGARPARAAARCLWTAYGARVVGERCVGRPGGPQQRYHHFCFQRIVVIESWTQVETLFSWLDFARTRSSV